MHLAEVTWTDVADAELDGALVPVGSTEQHGPHDPIGTDLLAAEAVARTAADAHDGEVLVAPGIPVGISREHAAFDGTMWVAPDTFRSYVADCVRSLAAHGIDRVVLVNGHGGNVNALEEVAGELSREGVARTAALTWFEVTDADVPMGHAGPRETAMMRATHPELVREDRVESAAERAAESWGEWVAGVNVAYDVSSFSENGTVGDPRQGDAELGSELLAAAAEKVGELLDALGP